MLGEKYVLRIVERCAAKAHLSGEKTVHQLLSMDSAHSPLPSLPLLLSKVILFGFNSHLNCSVQCFNFVFCEFNWHHTRTSNLVILDMQHQYVIFMFLFLNIFAGCHRDVKEQLCFSILWNFLSRRSGLNLGAMIDAAIQGNRTTYAEMREKTIQYVVDYVNKYLTVKQRTADMICGHMGHIFSHCSSCNSYGGCICSGSYLTGAYFFVKLLYVANSIGQLFLLNVFLGTDYHLYGFEVIRRFMEKDDWTQSHRFPRETICDFRMRHMNVVQRFVVQCALPINLFSEKIFIFLWFWFAALALFTVLSATRWLFDIIFWSKQITYVKHTLSIWISFDGRDTDAAKKFCVNYLRRDGIFLIRLLRSNVGHLIAAEVLKGLYDLTAGSFKDNMKRRNPMATAPRFKQMVDTMVISRRPESNSDSKIETVWMIFFVVSEKWKSLKGTRALFWRRGRHHCSNVKHVGGWGLSTTTKTTELWLRYSVV